MKARDDQSGRRASGPERPQRGQWLAERAVIGADRSAERNDRSAERAERGGQRTEPSGADRSETAVSEAVSERGK